MPYKKTGMAIAHYLRLFKRIALEFGNPFIIAYLPDPVVLDEGKYSRETIKRYLSWIKKFYRDKGREPPVRIEYVKDRVRGKVSSIYVDIDRIDAEVEWLEKDETPWPYRSRGRRDAEIERLRAKIRRLEEKIAKCNEELARYKGIGETVSRMERDYAETIEKLRARIKKLESQTRSLTGKNKKLIGILENLAKLTPEQVMDCVDLKPDTIECSIVRIILDKAITYVDDITPLDVVMGDVGDEYTEEIKELKNKVLGILEKYKM